MEKITNLNPFRSHDPLPYKEGCRLIKYTSSSLHIQTILTVNGYCSKLAEAVALPIKCASVIVDAMFKVCVLSAFLWYW